jgi:7-cyano-7-deazaguanine synthase
MKKAVVLVSGGLDSATVLALARRDGHACYALSVDYGQRHRVELAAAAKVARSLGAIEHKTVVLDLRLFGGSALTDDDIAVPTQSEKGIPVTYVPARNTIMLSLALAWAEVLGSHDLFIGANAVDYSGYPDCRPEYLRAYETMANLATRAAVEGALLSVHAPPVNLRFLDHAVLLPADGRRTCLRRLRRLPPAPQGIQRRRTAGSDPLRGRRGPLSASGRTGVHC